MHCKFVFLIKKSFLEYLVFPYGEKTQFYLTNHNGIKHIGQFELYINLVNVRARIAPHPYRSIVLHQMSALHSTPAHLYRYDR